MPVTTQVDFSRPGRQQGFLQVPYSHNLGAWANVMVPLVVVQQGRGPTVLVLGGNHGDEYQGPMAILNLARSLEPAQVAGRVILIPALNPPAALSATRLSPLDGMNMNRAFPGSSEGAVTSMIAHYLTTVLFPMADIVIDIHSGGRSLIFHPCSHMHLVPQLDQRRKMLEAMLAWNTDFSMLYTDIAGTGLLPVEAENQGKVVVTTELGGGEYIPASVHRLAREGLRNVLVHAGVLEGEVITRAALGKPPTRLVQALRRENYLLAPESGFFETAVELGEEVAAGDLLGRLHFLERPDREPIAVQALAPGVVMAMRAPARTQQGDCLVVVAEEVPPHTVQGSP